MGFLLGLDPAAARAITASGDAGNLWVVLPGSTREPTLTLLHRADSDPASRILRVITLSGRVLPHGLASDGEQLWLVYESLAVQSIPLVKNPMAGMPRYGMPQIYRRLPAAAELRALVAAPSQPWVLLRIEDRATLEALDKPPPATHPQDDNADEELSPAATQPQAPSTLPATAAGESSAAETSPASLHADRLVRLVRNRWVKADLPEDWPVDGRCWLLLPHLTDERPTLVAVPRGGGEVWVYRHDGDQWQRRVHPLDTTGELAAVSIEGQIVLGRRAEGGQDLSLELTLLRPESVSAIPALRIPDAAGASWSLLAVGQTLALVALDSNNQITWTREALSGEVILPPTPLEESAGYTLLDNTGFSLSMGVMAVALLIMFLVWRRDFDAARATFPEGYGPADLLRRALAALIDLAPAVLAVVLLWGIPPRELFANWYAQTPTREAMEPVLAVIGLFILHTFLTELFTASTLGKRLMGIRVASLDGKLPNIWQIAARNLFKAFDLLAWPLLILPLLRPYGQRLGDMVARTTVIGPQPAQTDDPPKEE